MNIIYNLPMAKPKDLSGKQFDQLTAIRMLNERRWGNVVWLCKCSCGNSITVPSGALTTGNTKSCGCIKLERIREANTKHGHNRNNKLCTPTYRSWYAMKQRCLTRGNKRWNRYGARGIKVCRRWLMFTNFLADMGERPSGKTLSRFGDRGDYKPGNVRWATAKEQAAERRRFPK